MPGLITRDKLNTYLNAQAYSVYERTLAAGEEQAIDSPGQFVSVLECSQPSFRLRIDDGRESYFTKGMTLQMPEEFFFGRVAIRNAVAVPMTITVAVGFGRFSDFRFNTTGTVLVQEVVALKIRGGAATFAWATVSIGNAPIQIEAANASRASGIVRAGNADLWLGKDAAVAAVGMPTIAAGEALAIAHVDAIWGVRAAAAAVQDAGYYKETV